MSKVKSSRSRRVESEYYVESNDAKDEKSFRQVFRGAQMAGLFPVTGLKNGKNAPNETIEFRPASFRLVATICFILAVIILEGLGLIHMLLFSQDEPDYKHGSAINSNFAPVLHYGTTVASVLLLLNMARHFPKTAELWELAESQIDCSGLSTSKCVSVSLMLLIIGMAILQTAFGTVGTALVASNSHVAEDSSNTTHSVTNAFQNFLEQYRSGSHGFISSIMDDTFWSGIVIFVVSNYTVIVWIVVDLILIFATRNISHMAHGINAGLIKPNVDLGRIRIDHWTLCKLSHIYSCAL